MQTVTRQPVRRADEPDRRPPMLRCVYCPTRGAVRDLVFPLLIGENPLGRENDDPDGVTLPEDLSLSRRHAVLTMKATRGGEYQLTVRDLDSKNGTFVNQAKVKGESVGLQRGDVLRAGDSFFVLTKIPVADAAIAIHNAAVIISGDKSAIEHSQGALGEVIDGASWIRTRRAK